MRAMSDWRSRRYLAAQRASKARRVARDAHQSIEEFACDVALRTAVDLMLAGSFHQEDAELEAKAAKLYAAGLDACSRVNDAHRRMVKAAGE